MKTFSEVTHAKMAFMCPKCYNMEKHDVLIQTKSDGTRSGIVKVEGANDSIGSFLTCCNTIMIPLDYKIAETVSILNKKGWLTSRSSEGYAEQYDSLPYIEFNQIWGDVGIFYNLPKGWVPVHNMVTGITRISYRIDTRTPIYHDDINFPEDELIMWAKSIPTLEEYWKDGVPTSVLLGKGVQNGSENKK